MLEQKVLFLLFISIEYEESKLYLINGFLNFQKINLILTLIKDLLRHHKNSIYFLTLCKPLMGLIKNLLLIIILMYLLKVHKLNFLRTENYSIWEETHIIFNTKVTNKWFWFIMLKILCYIQILVIYTWVFTIRRYLN